MHHERDLQQQAEEGCETAAAQPAEQPAAEQHAEQTGPEETGEHAAEKARPAEEATLLRGRGVARRAGARSALAAA